jgi:hypothetical protein
MGYRVDLWKELESAKSSKNGQMPQPCNETCVVFFGGNAVVKFASNVAKAPRGSCQNDRKAEEDRVSPSYGTGRRPVGTSPPAARPSILA